VCSSQRRHAKRSTLCKVQLGCEKPSKAKVDDVIYKEGGEDGKAERSVFAIIYYVIAYRTVLYTTV